MNDIFLYASGAVGMATSLIHCYIGEFKVVRPVRASSVPAKRILSAVMFLSGVYWFVASALLIATPAFVPDSMRTIVACGVAAIYLSGTLANLWGTRGRHFGWVLLALAAGLAIAGR